MRSLENLVNQFPKLVEQFSKELQTAWQVSLSKQFKDKDNKFFNSSNQLRSSRGGKSLKADLSKNAKVKINDGKVELEFTTDKPYAGIQNRGGFIKATPIQRRLKTGKTVKTYKMSQYFWAKYFEASDGRLKNIYKRMALSVQAKGGVKIKGKNYLEGSVKDFEQMHLQRVLDAFLTQVLRVWNAS